MIRRLPFVLGVASFGAALPAWAAASWRARPKRLLDGENGHMDFVAVVDVYFTDLVSAAREANLTVLGNGRDKDGHGIEWHKHSAEDDIKCKCRYNDLMASRVMKRNGTVGQVGRTSYIYRDFGRDCS